MLRHIINNILCIELPTIVMSSYNTRPSKAQALLEEGTLNTAADKISDPKFHEGEFFDPRDIVQVKYEMLRRVRVENVPVAHAAEQYGQCAFQ